MAGGTEHTLLEDFTQCKPQLVSVPLNDSVSLKTVGHPDDRWEKPEPEEPTTPWDSSQAEDGGGPSDYIFTAGSLLPYTNKYVQGCSVN